MPPKPKKEPVALTPAKLAGFMALLPLCITFFIVGVLGMFILMDPENENFLSRTQFGVLYKKLIAMNPFFSAMFVNGGMIGSMFAVARLVEHRSALKKAKVAAIAGKEKKPETKKEK